jgi:hypothetical protein
MIQDCMQRLSENWLSSAVHVRSCIEGITFAASLLKTLSKGNLMVRTRIWRDVVSATSTSNIIKVRGGVMNGRDKVTSTQK